MKKKSVAIDDNEDEEEATEKETPLSIFSDHNFNKYDKLFDY